MERETDEEREEAGEEEEDEQEEDEQEEDEQEEDEEEEDEQEDDVEDDTDSRRRLSILCALGVRASRKEAPASCSSFVSAFRDEEQDSFPLFAAVSLSAARCRAQRLKLASCGTCASLERGPVAPVSPAAAASSRKARAACGASNRDEAARDDADASGETDVQVDRGKDVMCGGIEAAEEGKRGDKDEEKGEAQKRRRDTCVNTETQRERPGARPHKTDQREAEKEEEEEETQDSRDEEEQGEAQDEELESRH
ncbi:hypothetical protein TGMAS_413320 [Toxoplasma gondii MAS]|uniref:Uncharacterized protein n=1 Tax=Toxoplasma gondii MAS TaxID=943118 RepID=A0A086QVR6_TOXGO|nr:hypothetical protein TGMAS_413320 [Toxoplasma gondii MAS]